MKSARRRRGGSGELLLERILADGPGGAQGARLVIDAALVDSVCDAVPDDPAGLLLFVRDHVAPRVTRSYGVRAAARRVEELELELGLRTDMATYAPPPDYGSGVRVRRVAVLLIEPLVVLRAGLTRALQQGHCDVTAVPDAAAAAAFLGDGPPLDVLILDPTNADQANLAAALPPLPRPLALVAWSSRTRAELEPLLKAAGAALAAIAPRGATHNEVMITVRRAAPARRDETG